MSVLVQQIANGLLLGSSYVLVALGLMLVFGVLNIPNFAHGEMFMVGALVTAHLASGGVFGYLWAGLVAIGVVIVVGVVMERVAFRPLQNAPHVSLLIASLAVAILLQELAGLIWGTKPVSTAAPVTGVIDLLGIRIATYRLIVVAIAAVGVWVVWLVIYRSKLGREMRAVAQNRDAAQLAGISLPVVTIATFALGSALTGLAGVLLAGTQALTPFIGFHPTLVAFAILVMAGVGRVLGAVVGGLAVGLAETMTAGYISPSYQSSVVFLGLVVFLILKPGGAIQVKEKV